MLICAQSGYQWKWHSRELQKTVSPTKAMNKLASLLESTFVRTLDTTQKLTPTKRMLNSEIKKKKQLHLSKRALQHFNLLRSHLLIPSLTHQHAFLYKRLIPKGVAWALLSKNCSCSRHLSGGSLKAWPKGLDLFCETQYSDRVEEKTLKIT